MYDNAVRNGEECSIPSPPINTHNASPLSDKHTSCPSFLPAWTSSRKRWHGGISCPEAQGLRNITVIFYNAEPSPGAVHGQAKQETYCWCILSSILRPSRADESHYCSIYFVLLMCCSACWEHKTFFPQQLILERVNSMKSFSWL